MILERGIDYLKEQAAEGLRNGTGDEGGLKPDDRRGLEKLEEHLEALVLNKRTSVRRPASKGLRFRPIRSYGIQSTKTEFEIDTVYI